MDVLLIHQNFPGQYRHLAPALQRAGHRCLAIGGPTAPGLVGVPMRRVQYRGNADPSGLHPWVRDLQVKCLRAEAVARQAIELRQEGLRPQLIIGHPGWGELLAIKDVFPEVPVLHQLEFVYQLHGGDTDFDPEFASGQRALNEHRGGDGQHASSWQAAAKLRLRRAPQLLALHDLDHAMAPTHWQAGTAPAMFRDRISVIHEGIDSGTIRPDPQARITLKAAGLSFQPGDELVTYVARSLEPYRGFHIFMRMLPLLLQRRPHCHVVIVGGDGVSYGARPADGRSWRELLLEELRGELDGKRVHFVGRVAHGVLHQLFQVSACHVYLTYPFVLSWSLLEAMSCGAVVVASATEPVLEVIEDNVNGRLADFFDCEGLVAQVLAVLDDREAGRVLGEAARRTVQERYDLMSICLPAQLRLVEKIGRNNC